MTKTGSVSAYSKEYNQISKWEIYAIRAIFSIYFVWQLNAIIHLNMFGQDYHMHINLIDFARKYPWQFLVSYSGHRTSPPLYHFLASLVFRITPNSLYAYSIFSLLILTINIAALYLLYRMLRKIISTPVVRFACMTLLLFLPFAMIHAVVLAADGLATPLHIILLFLFTLFTKPRSQSAYFVIIGGIAMLLVIALMVKFTFVSLVPAAILAYIVLYRASYLNKKCTFIGITLVLILSPFLILGYFTNQYSGLAILPSKDWPNPIYSPYMNLRSLLFPKAIDVKLLAAPLYNISEDNQIAPPYNGQNAHIYTLLQNNRFSYPSLLHLAMFTDLMNIYQYKHFFGARTPAAQALMAISVKTGLFFSIGMAIVIPLSVVSCAVSILRRQKDMNLVYSTLLILFSCAFFLTIVVFFPFIPSVYIGGYWLPRLVVPALLCFFILSFAFFDKFIASRLPAAGWICLALVILQSGLHLSFLWSEG
ncbi:MAG: glycosyltransferase family 39 protein [Methylococcales bacterium]